MEKIRRNRFANFVVAFGLSALTVLPAQASGTKVGNGDDGADLEALSFITTGPIFEARARAVETVKQLNVIGIPGLSLLIPELEHTNLLMARANVHPTGEQKGSLEVSADKGFVYARTFAEPYAATRFFPIAETLSSDQLVALHIHEALHRALPSDIRGDEDKVMHLTMALTSPGASYDRVHQVAGLYIQRGIDNTAQAPSAILNTSLNTEALKLPAKSATEVKYRLDLLNERKFTQATNVLHGLEIEISLGGYRQIKSLAIEPVFRFRGKFFKNFGESSSPGLGVSSYDLEGRVAVNEDSMAGPFVRFTLKSLDEQRSYSFNGRDVTTVGAFYRNSSSDSYFESTLFYSFGSTTGNGEYYSAQYKPILSLTGRRGFKWRRLTFGGLVDIHSSEGRQASEYEQVSEAANYDNWAQRTQGLTRPGFRLLAIGPELGYEGKVIQIKYYAKMILNASISTFDDLGDVMDRGGGDSMTGVSLSALF